MIKSLGSSYESANLSTGSLLCLPGPIGEVKGMAKMSLFLFSISILLLLALPCPPSGIAQDAASSSAKPAPVELTVTVTDKLGRYVSGLSKDQITVLDEKMPQEITFFKQLNLPMNIGLVFDMSRGNYAGLLASTRKAFLDFIGTGEKANEYFIMGFDRDAYLAVDWTQTREGVATGIDKLASVKPSKKAALYDALYAAIRKVSSGAHAKRVIILISEGKDNGSKLGREELFDVVRQSSVLMYAISAKTGSVGLFGSPDNSTLNSLCSISGGLASYPRNEVEFYTFFERLLVELKNQYSLSFIPGESAPGSKWHQLSFKAKTLEAKKTPSSKGVEKIPLFVRSREGYYRSR